MQTFTIKLNEHYGYLGSQSEGCWTPTYRTSPLK